MKTPMNVFNTAMKKKNKNRKGFSLVELIVVLVIMAILAAALVPTLIGYIRQTRQSNVKNEAASAVSAAQTIASSAFADTSGKYISKATGSNVTLTIYNGDERATFGTLTGKKGAAANKNGAHTVTTDDAQGIFDTVELLSEVPGDVTYFQITDGKVSALCYENGDDAVYYNGSNYEVV